MGAENDGAWLHDKATRGEELSSVEQERLDAWYAAQDAAEGALLAPPIVSTTVATLHEQIAATAAELQVAARRVGELAAHNDALREEVAALQQQLVERARSRVA